MKKILVFVSFLTAFVFAFMASGAPAARIASAATTTDATSTDATSTEATSTDDTVATTSTQYAIQIMEHTCPTIGSTADWNAVTGASGLDPLDASLTTFLSAEIACPTTALPGDEPADNASSAPRMNFDYTIEYPNATDTSDMSEATGTLTLSDATYVQDKKCETDANADLNNDGTISPSTCVDASYYEFPLTIFGTTTASTSSSTVNAPESAIVTITETEPPSGMHYGTFHFTPTALMANNDADTFISQSMGSMTGTASTSSSTDDTGTITLDLSKDNDAMVMLHVFNFANGTTSNATTSTSTDNGNGDDNGTSTDNNGGNDNGNGGAFSSIFDRINARLDTVEAQISNRLDAVRTRLQTIQDRLNSTGTSSSEI